MKKGILILILLIGVIMAANAEVVKIKMTTSKGVIELELYPDKAPVTVENFVKYANDGFFDGLVFHRVISNFMIQGGGFDIEGNQKAATYKSIQNEADNGLSNLTGTIAMARTNAPHSATCQFFINVKDNGFLNHKDKKQNWGYCVFGKVTSGMDVVEEIKATRTSNHAKTRMPDWPIENIVIEKVEVIK